MLQKMLLKCLSSMLSLDARLRLQADSTAVQSTMPEVHSNEVINWRSVDWEAAN